MKIFGFIHICMINHWQAIVDEQLKALMSSGLYETSENIFVGCLGNMSEFVALRKLINPYDKIKVAYYSPKVDEYEFATLKILKDKSDKEQFYGWYIHTKGVSWFYGRNPKAFAGGTYWRQSMNYYTIARWQDNIANLDLGYETSGSQIRTARTPPAYKLHYSGNYFWFKSDYVKLLSKVETLNKSNRHEAEMYICAAHPIAATLNQEWIDYDTNKIWENPK